MGVRAHAVPSSAKTQIQAKREQRAREGWSFMVISTRAERRQAPSGKRYPECSIKPGRGKCAREAGCATPVRRRPQVPVGDGVSVGVSLGTGVSVSVGVDVGGGGVGVSVGVGRTVGVSVMVLASGGVLVWVAVAVN